MIDAMFQSGTDQALDDQVARPKPFQPEAPGFSLLRAPLRVGQGISSASTKTAAFAAEVLGAFGQTEAATGVSAGGMFATQTPEERKQAEEARRKVLENDDLFSNEAGDLLRQRAKEVMPDPTKTHAAEQIIAGVAEFATQAVTYAAGAGPVAPLLLAGDVGMAEADKLKQEGVDLATRTKAGAVAGAVAGVSVALPVAVPTSVAKTTALVVAGGPGGFIAQNAAERAILQNAGYDKQANQYDPLDPVGLALSTLVPAGFGAVAVRGARAKPAPTANIHDVVLGIESGGRRFGKDGKILEGPVTKQGTAKGEMQVVDATNLDPGFGVRPAADNSPAERARVGHDYLDAMLKRYGGDEAKAMAAYNAGPGALDIALKKGGNWLDHMPAETQAYVTKGMKKLGGGRTDSAARAAVAADADTVAAARVRQTGQMIDSYRLTPETDLPGMAAHQDAIESAHAMLARGEPVQVSDILAPTLDRSKADFDTWFMGSKASTPDGSPMVLYRGEERVFSDRQGQWFTSDAKAASDYAESLAGGYGEGANVRPVNMALRNPLEFDAKGGRYDELKFEGVEHNTETLAQRAAELGHDGLILRNVKDGSSKAIDVYHALSPDQIRSTFEPRVVATAKGARALQDVMPPRAPATGRQLFEAAGESTLPDAKPKADAAGAALGKQAAEVAELNPDLMVQLEGMDKPQRVGDLLEAVKKEAAEDAQEASFVETAVNCLLRTG